MDIRRWDVGPSTFLVLPEFGARLLNWHVNMGDGSVRDVIYWPETASAKNLKSVDGGIPVLFPFCGTCIHKGEKNRWLCPDGMVREMPQHGFAQDAQFRIRSMDQSGFEVELMPKESFREFYPYEFTFTVIYHFLELSLQVSLVLENEGREPIPWSAGLHPFFQVPWRKDLLLENHLLHLEAKKSYQYRPDGSFLDNPKNEYPTALGNEGLINRIHYQLESSEAEISLLNGEEIIRVNDASWAGKGSRSAYVTWTKPGAPFFCLEPWMSPPNAPENKTVNYVTPGGREEFTIEIDLA